MIAADTNVVVRVLTNDDPDQARREEDLLAREQVFLSRTVILESESVLRHAYAVERSTICRALRRLLGLPAVTAEDPSAVAEALEWYERGLDFADALHLVRAREAGATAFVTFDRKLVRQAEELSGISAVEP